VEAGVRRGLLGATLVLWLGVGRPTAQAQEGPPPAGENLTAPAPRPRTNAAADEVSRRALRLGLDFNAEDSLAGHPSAEDVEALALAGWHTWLDSQLTIADGSISREPESLRDFLESRRDALWQVVAALESEPPDWSSSELGRFEPSPHLLALNRLNGLLLAVALVEERAGRSVESRRLVEASWSIHRSLAKSSGITPGILGVAVMRRQVGVLRKLREPSVEWLKRLGTDDPWKRTVGRFENKQLGVPSLAADALSASFANAHARALRAVAENLRRMSPCDIQRTTAEEIGRPMLEELRKLKSPGEDSEQIAALFTDMEIPALIGPLERAGRLAVDQELTLKIVELRFAKSGSGWVLAGKAAARRVPCLPRFVLRVPNRRRRDENRVPGCAPGSPSGPAAAAFFLRASA
jgi:hypothetical protein